MTKEKEKLNPDIDDQVAVEDEETETVDVEEIGSSGDSEEKTYSKADVDREITKSVDNALKRQQKKLEEQRNKEVANAVAKALKEAKMSEEELLESKLTEREKELERREREQETRELLVEVQEKLVENDMPATFAEYIVSDDRDKTLEAVDSFKSEWDRAISEKTKEKARQKEPIAKTNTVRKTSSIAELAKKNRKV